MDDAQENGTIRAMARKNCGNCLYATPMLTDGYRESRTMFCNRYPPIPILMEGGKLSTKSPAVHFKHWCGEWVAR